MEIRSAVKKRKSEYSSNENVSSGYNFEVDLNDHIRKFRFNDSECESDFSPIFIVGLPRSGSSLLYQYIASFEEIGFIDGIASTFWENPAVGLQLSTTLRSRFDSSFSFGSNIGKGLSVFSPHEFMFFWDRHFASNVYHQKVDVENFTQSNRNALIHEVNSMMNILSKPLVFKSQFWLSQNVGLLKSIFPNSKIVYIQRDPRYVMQSIYQARLKLKGDINQWWSVLPFNYSPQFDWKKDIPNQVFRMEKIVEDSLKMLDHVKVVYEDIIENANVIDLELREYLGISDSKWTLKEVFTSKNSLKVDVEVFDELSKNYTELSHE